MAVGKMLFAALGDGIGLDVYPESDYAQRYGRPLRGLGAASLLYRNNDQLWPAFRGRDLYRRFGRSRWTIHAMDGATIAAVREKQLPVLARGTRIVTIAAGGNDLLEALGVAEDRQALEAAVRTVQKEFTALVDEVVATGAELVIVNTIYDPTDGTGRLPPLGDRLPMELLDATNDAIRATAKAHASVAVADIHAHFLGHGATAGRPAELWYLAENIIEPGFTGASEIRRVWLDVLQQRGVLPQPAQTGKLSVRE